MAEHQKRNYDSTLARIAGNVAPVVLAALSSREILPPVERVAHHSVRYARAILQEIEATELEPKAEPEEPQRRPPYVLVDCRTVARAIELLPVEARGFVCDAIAADLKLGGITREELILAGLYDGCL